jgi:GH25 family lysozyme M1 (1,4-beta-N-acetylmuramidase)
MHRPHRRQWGFFGLLAALLLPVLSATTAGATAPPPAAAPPSTNAPSMSYTGTTGPETARQSLSSAPSDSGSTRARPESVSGAVGPDVSSWNHPSGAAIDWHQVAVAGNSFAFVKATEGPTTVGGSFYVNPYFASDFAGAANNGLYRGAYDFARPALPFATATAQAQAFIATTGTLQGARDLPPVLDLETDGGLSPSDLLAWTSTWLTTAQGLTGRVPMIYTSPGFWSSSMANTTALSQYHLWEAHWTSAASPQSIPGWNQSWSFWQYTDDAAVPGISAPTDVSRYRGSVASLALLAGPTLTWANASHHLYLRNSTTSGVADVAYPFGAPPGGRTLMCDWDGNGTDTPGVFVNGTWYITNSTSGGVADQVFGYGQPGDIPVCGDWDGNGTETPGIFRNGTWYLVNSLGQGIADVSFGYGNPTDTPVVGDWDGNGTDTPGIFRNGIWYLVNSIGKGSADGVFAYGNPTDRPVVGDWDGNGTDTPGIFRNGMWYLVNSLGKGIADTSFAYGNPTDTPLGGRWGSAKPSTVGIAR